MSLAQIQARFTELSDAACELRIIAADSRGLSVADRACIKEAADEHDELGRMVVQMQAELVEARQVHIALNERALRLGSEIIALRDQLEQQSSWLVTINAPFARYYGPVQVMS